MRKAFPLRVVDARRVAIAHAPAEDTRTTLPALIAATDAWAPKANAATRAGLTMQAERRDGDCDGSHDGAERDRRGRPGRRTAYSMCGMYAIGCLIAVTVDDGRVAWRAEFNR